MDEEEIDNAGNNAGREHDGGDMPGTRRHECAPPGALADTAAFGERQVIEQAEHPVL